MEKLLKWSITSAAHDPQSGQESPKPDQQLLAELFGAPDDAQLIKAALETACDKSIDITNREVALDNLEILIENLDNANNLENMGLWPSLLRLLDDESAVIRKMACWVVGTAIQNNEKSQAALAKNQGSIAKLVRLALEDPDFETSMKAIYAVIGAVQHCSIAYAEFDANNGWQLVEMLVDKNQPQIKKKIRGITLTQVLSIIEPGEEKLNRIKKLDVLETVLQSLRHDRSNHELNEKALRLFSTLVSVKYMFTVEQLNEISALRKKIIEESKGDIDAADYPFF